MKPPPGPFRRRARALAAIALLVALLMLPNGLWLPHAHGLTAWVSGFVLPPVLLTAVFALLGRWPWLACLLLAPLALLAPLETFYVATYHTPSTAEVIATVMATNGPEMRSYLGAWLWLLPLAALPALALALLAAWWSFRSGLRWRGRLRRGCVAIAVLTPLASVTVGLASGQGSLADRWQAAGTPVLTVVDATEPGYPFGVILRVAGYRRQWAAMRADALRFRHFSFHATRAQPQPQQRQVYVLVIGESSARTHWQLFGYSRPTNPQLSRLPNLVPIRRMITSWPETLAAVPLLLTRKPITSNQPQWKEPSFLPAMQEAGFTTWWISNQYPVGKYDSAVASYAYEAQHVVWANHTVDWHHAGSDDGDLIAPLRRALGASTGDLFIVLHMMGSHLPYDARYPPAFARFKPIESSHHSHVVNGLRIRNSYDNTIVYTDHVLAQVIDVLQHSGAVTALWYESDHGEVLPSPTCDKEGHGIGTWHEYEIPALFWYADTYRKDFPRRVATLRANAGKRTLSADTFSSMIDMAGVTFPGHDETWSLFSPKWHYRTRIVGQIWYSDFDHAIYGKPCGLVMPANGK